MPGTHANADRAVSNAILGIEPGSVAPRSGRGRPPRRGTDLAGVRHAPLCGPPNRAHIASCRAVKGPAEAR